MPKNKIHFNINYKKSISVLLYIIEQCQNSVNQYNLLKMIFAADKYHLNQYLRPVTGDYYVKMDYGTVPSHIYNMLKNDNPDLYLNEIDMNEFPFDILTEGKKRLVVSNMRPDLDLLSESDIEAINFGIQAYKDLGFNEVKNKNHKEKCWLSTEDNERIDFDKMIDDKSIIGDLIDASNHIVL